ncbi:MAG: hypothetical protein M3083_02480 [Actinomycetota bacterium]|nr:hypothetical protein [Actinomycetota bacterium]MDQ6947432.1 hypothetical protein [Actinomycetota bacterium]
MWLNQFPGLLEMTIDFENDELVIVTSDRGEVRQRGIRALAEPGTTIDLKRITYRVAENILVMVTEWGDELETELFLFDDQQERRTGRPVVYLDQNKWVQVAQAIHAPERVHLPELGPTRQLIELAAAKEVILPISSGHWIETGPLYGHRRDHVAASMVGLSRGWIMRDPVLVRMLELVSLFKCRRSSLMPVIDEPVFTLDHRAVYFEAMPSLGHSSLPPEVAMWVDVLSGASAIFAVLLEDDAVCSHEGAEATRRWAEEHQQAANVLASNSGVRTTSREFTLRWFLKDLWLDLGVATSTANVNVEEFGEWLESEAEADVAMLPYLGRAREVVHRRMLNAQDTWTSNDLIDLLFLPCAAGYADHVVCERKTAADLRAVRRKDEGAAVHRTVAELLRALESHAS